MLQSHEAEAFRLGYVEAMLFANAVDDVTGESVDLRDFFVNSGVNTIPDDVAEAMADDCLAFLEGAASLIREAVITHPRYSWWQAGADFALTRNGHGAGYWDRGLDSVGMALTYMAKPYGERTLLLDGNDDLTII